MLRRRLMSNYRKKEWNTWDYHNHGDTPLGDKGNANDSLKAIRTVGYQAYHRFWVTCDYAPMHRLPAIPDHRNVLGFIQKFFPLLTTKSLHKLG